MAQFVLSKVVAFPLHRYHVIKSWWYFNTVFAWFSSKWLQIHV